MNLSDILKDSNYKLEQFSDEYKTEIQDRTFLKIVKGKKVPFVKCIVREKDIQLKPEEVIRQLYLLLLTKGLEYPKERIELEYGVSFGREKKRADIVIFDKDQTTTPYIIVEVKKPKLKEGKEQLKSYCNATGAPIGVWTNGNAISYYHRKDPNYKLEQFLNEYQTNISDTVDKAMSRIEKRLLNKAKDNFSLITVFGKV